MSSPALQGSVNGGRRRGRQRTKLTDNITERTRNRFAETQRIATNVIALSSQGHSIHVAIATSSKHKVKWTGQKLSYLVHRWPNQNDLIRRASRKKAQKKHRPAVDGVFEYGIESFETPNLGPILPCLNLLLKCTDFSSNVGVSGEFLAPSLITKDIGPDLKYDVVGEMAECIDPQIYPSHTNYQKGQGIFPTLSTAYKGYSSTSEQASVEMLPLLTPKDTFVCDVGESARDIDLVMVPSGSGVEYICLIPVNPSLWRGKTSRRGKTLFLEHILINNMKGSHLAFQCVWPKEAHEWLSRPRKSRWLNDRQINKIKSYGCRVIPVSTDSTVESDKTTEWKLSFAVAQRIILRNCTTIPQKTCYRITRMLLDYVLDGKVFVHGDLLKNVFMSACDEIELDHWAEIPTNCIMFIIHKFYNCLRKTHLSNYFLICMNMLNNIPPKDFELLLRNLAILSEYPLFVVYFLIDYYGYMNKTVSRTCDKSLNEINGIYLCTDLQQLYSKFILPDMVGTIDELVNKNDFKQAGTVYLVTEDQLKKDIPLFPWNKIQENLKALSPESRWCFAFFIDQTQNSHLLDVIFRGVPSVSITHVIGPECCKELGYPRIPTVLYWRQNVLSFMCKLVKVFDELKYYEIKGKALMYFLDRVYIKSQSRFIFDDVEAPTFQSGYGPIDEISKKVVYLQLTGLYLYLQIYLTPAREDLFMRYLEGYEHASIQLEDKANLISIARIWINHKHPAKAERLLDCLESFERKKKDH